MRSIFNCIPAKFRSLESLSKVNGLMIMLCSDRTLDKATYDNPSANSRGPMLITAYLKETQFKFYISIGTQKMNHLSEKYRTRKECSFYLV